MVESKLSKPQQNLEEEQIDTSSIRKPSIDSRQLKTKSEVPSFNFEENLTREQKFHRWQKKNKLASEIDDSYYHLELNDDFHERIKLDQKPTNMTPEDKLVWKILKTAKPLVEKALGKPIEVAEDSSDDDPDEKISRFDFSNNYYKYRNSVKRFKATSEELFWLLRYRSMIQEQVEEASLGPEEQDASTEPQQLPGLSDIDRLSLLPLEIKVLILQYTGPRGFFKSLQLSQAWRDLLGSQDGQSQVAKKYFGQLVRRYCQDTWPAHLCHTTKSFLLEFKNYRNMLQYRPKVRFDGIYKCKIIYYRRTQSDFSEYFNTFEVICYRYIRFFRDGSTASIQTVKPPKKIFPKIKSALLSCQAIKEESEQDETSFHSLSEQDPNSTVENPTRKENGKAKFDSGALLATGGKEMFFELGRFSVRNEKIIVIQSQEATDYRYDLVGHRTHKGINSSADAEYLELVWSGFQIDQRKIELDPVAQAEIERGVRDDPMDLWEEKPAPELQDQGMFIKMKPLSHFEQRFNFIKVPEFDRVR